MNKLLSGFLRHVRRQVASDAVGEASDRELLRRFARDRNADAFALLVQRHGPLVLGVCRRVLSQPQDAEDAFQATFLVLARKAGSVGRPELLGNWLYGVALRVARKARERAARWRASQGPVPDVPAGPDSRAAEREELRQVLDDEVQRLPDRFRAPLVLCYWQGLTREAAAARLGRSAGAVKGSLERGRELLRSRLARRGVTLSAGALATLLAEEALAAVPAALGESTVKAALAFAAGHAGAAGSAAALAEGVLRTMFITRLKWRLSLVLLLVLAGGGAGLLAFGGRSTEQAARPQGGTPQGGTPAPQGDAQTDRARQRTAARLDAAKAAYEGCWARYEAGAGPEADVHLWSRRWLQAQLDLSATRADRTAALAAYQERLKKTDEIARARLLLGNSPVYGIETPEVDPDLRKFKSQGERFDLVWKSYMNRERQTGEEQVCLASIHWLMYQHLLSKLDKRINPKTELQAHLDRVKRLEEVAAVRFDVGAAAEWNVKTATFYRLQAEEWLDQGKVFEQKDLVPPGAPK